MRVHLVAAGAFENVGLATPVIDKSSGDVFGIHRFIILFNLNIPGYNCVGEGQVRRSANANSNKRTYAFSKKPFQYKDEPFHTFYDFWNWFNKNTKTKHATAALQKLG